MGPILIIIAVLLVIAKHDKTKKRHKRTMCGKSDWEKTCDDGGKFFGGENGAFPPTRNGCIHSLSMRERG